MTGTIASFHRTESVLIAAGITAALCLAITLFATQTRIDFTMCSAMLFVLTIVVFITGIVCAIVYAVSGPNRVSVCPCLSVSIRILLLSPGALDHSLVIL